VRGKWAAGIEPRNFTWVFRDKWAVSERPGGSTLVHRRVRRDEELLWLKHHKVNRIISTLQFPQNIEAYEQHHIAAATYPLGGDAEQGDVIVACYRDLKESMERGDVVLLHGDEVSDRLLGLVAGYLLWTKRVESEPLAIAAVERLFGRSMSIDGRDVLKNLPGESA
jgi:hypothetical protein